MPQLPRRDLPRGGKRFLRAAGISVWILSGTPAFLLASGLVRSEIDGETVALPPGRLALWLGAALIFAAAFWITSGAVGTDRHLGLYRLLLAVQTAAALTMFHLICTGLEIALLVVVAVQLGLFVPVAVGLGWVLLQTLLLGCIGFVHQGGPMTALWMGIALPFETLALFTSYFAAGEAHARRDLTRANAELRATQELLADSSRMAERLRISRELHDVLGHRLTALALNLEAARHRLSGAAVTEVERCQELARELLGGVREVVRSSRGERAVDLARALAPLTEDIPTPRIHLELEPDLEISDPERAHALVRAVQEIVTNAVKHAAAENLWVEVRRRDGELEIHARDDGRGTEQVRPGHGLTGMRERLERLGGRLSFESAPRRGFTVVAHLPLGGGSP